MGARTGAQYIADLKKMRREIWIGGERVEDVTTHPATRRGVASYAHLYDMQADPYLPAGIVETNSDGVVIRGCRMLATSAPLADEIMVFPSTVVRNADADKYAFAFSVPTDIPGMKFICRESLDQGRSHFDHPLGSRFEEMDAIV